MQKYGHGHKTIDPPLDIQQMAKQEELGELRKVYVAARLSRNTLFAGGLCFIVGSTWALFWGIIAIALAFVPFMTSPTPSSAAPQFDAHLTIAISIPGFLLLIMGFYLTLLRKPSTPWHVYLWQHGFIYEKKQLLKVFHWNQIATVKAASTIAEGKTFFTCTILRRDGAEVKLEPGFSHILELLDVVLAESARHLSTPEPRIASPDSLQTFTHIELDRHGISDTKETLAWESIREISIKNGSVNILKKDGPGEYSDNAQLYDRLDFDFSEERFD